MHTLRNDRRGFSVIELVIVLAIIGVVAAAIFYVAQKSHQADNSANNTGNDTSQNTAAGPVRWQYSDRAGKYVASGKPATCPKPLFSTSPVDTSRATSVLYPGQYRGMNYKPHGGFGFDSSVQVVAPMDGTLTGLVRYIERGKLQYKLSFQNTCGIEYYFDHLNNLSPDLMAVAKTTPEPLVDDTRSTPRSFDFTIKTGDTIGDTTGLDFGVLDLRKSNEISKNATWAALHQQFKPSEWYGICWFDQLPAADAARVKALPARDQKSGTRSDYCTNDMGTTLDVNDGKPV